MRSGFGPLLISAAFIIGSVWLSMVWQYQFVSIIAWPLVIATFLAFTYRGWLLGFIIMLLLAELSSQSVPGTMAAAVLIPYLTQRFLHKDSGLLDGRLWFLVTVTILLQLGLITILSMLDVFSVRELDWLLFTTHMPWRVLIWQWIVMALWAIVGIGFWHERGNH